MDGTTSIPVETFFRMLARLVPTHDRRSMPWDAIPWRPRIHLGLFVHRVRDLPPGLYALTRDPDMVEAFRAAIHFLVNSAGDVDGLILAGEVKFKPHVGLVVVTLLERQAAPITASGLGTRNAFGTVVDADSISVGGQILPLRAHPKRVT